MLTRCPTCRTTFHVNAEQLKARQGRVRCGHCQGVFNALEMLVEEAPPAPAAPPLPPSPAVPAAESVVIRGFQVPPIEAAPEPIPSPVAAAEPAATPSPVEPEPAPVEREEVAEPSIEFVDIGELNLGDIALQAPAAGESVEEALTRTEIDIPPLDDFDLGEIEEPESAVEPPAEDPYVKTVVGFTWYVEPEPPAPAPEPELAEEDLTKTVVQSIRIAEVPSAAEAPPRAPAPTMPSATRAAPEAAGDDSEFAKTVVQSIRMFEPAAPAAEDFTKTTIQPRAVADSALGARPAPPSVFSFPTIEPLAVEEVSVPALAQESPADEFARTMVEVPPMATHAAEEFADEAFDLGPIDDLEVEEAPEPPSIVELAKLAPTTFPTLPPLAEGDELTAGQSANAILEQLSASPVAAPAWPTGHAEPDVQAHVMDDETATIPLRKAERALRAAAEAAPPAEEVEIEAPAAAVAHAIPELQELPARRRWPWVLGSLIALAALALQAIVYYRVELSVLLPRSKPALVALCDVFDCKVSLPSQIDLIGIETSDLSPGPEGAGHLQLAATLRNRAPFVQAWPDLELTLTDNADKALVRRVLTPADYLPPGHKAGAGFAARSEQTVYLDLKAPGVPAVGYRLYVFYP